MSEIDAIKKIAEVASAVGFQAGVPATDIAGQLVSFLYVHPEHVERFMREGAELFIDGTIQPEWCGLTYRTGSGETLSPADLRRHKGISDQ